MHTTHTTPAATPAALLALRHEASAAARRYVGRLKGSARRFGLDASELDEDRRWTEGFVAGLEASGEAATLRRFLRDVERDAQALERFEAATDV